MVSFSQRFYNSLLSRGYQVSYDLNQDTDAILVIGGTKQLAELHRAKKRGIRIVQRLNGLNWMHRKKATGWKHFLRAEYGNFILSTIRNHLADHIIYQSNFVIGWWEKKFGVSRVSYNVVHNGVDLDQFSPQGVEFPPDNFYRILLVEGNLGGGYESGLMTALSMAEQLQLKLEKPLELMVVGGVTPQLQSEVESHTPVKINWTGRVSGDQIPAIDRSAHLLYSADLNAACPNAVIEALACGLPIVSYDTGALPELVCDQAGRIAAYGGDPWQLDEPDIPSLADAAQYVLTNQKTLRQGARRCAEENYGLENMVDQYLKILMETN